MVIRLDPRSDEPIYLQLVKQIKHLAVTGHLKPDMQLPAVRRLALDLHVNPNTVARAYTQLAQDGIISTQQGRGTFILEQPVPADQRQLRRERLRQHVEKFLHDVERLGYVPDEVEPLWQKQFTAWQHTLGRKS
jgi:GntR family transcriptional regulator